MGKVTTFCTLWKLRLKDGKVYALTDHDGTVEFEGSAYHPQHGADAGASESQSGFAIDTGEIRTRLNVSGLSDVAVRAGALDEGELCQYRHDWVSGETILLSTGRVGDVRFSGNVIEVEWLGQTSRLDQSTGRVFSRQCDASFGDIRCGLDAKSFPTGTTCPRSFSACRDQFSNAVNFRGFPYLLGDDVLQAGVGSSSVRDGSSRYI